MSAELVGSKKFGLIFEKDTGFLVDHFDNKIPVPRLVHEPSITGTENAPEHILLEGDNIDSLMLLNQTHKESVQVIYIDPPYNTHQKDFNYKDSYADASNSFKHSSWLAFMEPRLEMARQLLSTDGFIAISIDDRELYYLKPLMDRIFGENNFIANTIWQSRSSGNDAKNIAVLTEYILLYAKNISNLKFSQKKTTTSFPLRDEFFEERGGYKLDKLDRASLKYSSRMDYPVFAPDGTEFYAGGVSREAYESRLAGNTGAKDWCWRWSRDRVNSALSHGMIVFKKNPKTNAWSMYNKSYEFVDKDLRPTIRTNPYTNIIPSSQFSSRQGTKEIQELFGSRVFLYPKPVKLVEFLVNLYPGKNATVLDFFAGSGTTGHAVMSLNSADGGRRQFILGTNNSDSQNTSHGIARDIAAERIRRVITGQYADKKARPALRDNNFSYYVVSTINSAALEDSFLDDLRAIKGDSLGDYSRGVLKTATTLVDFAENP